ncbi:hypothetical protein ACOME3_004297 [Neoechinorhynchus agilis]
MVALGLILTFLTVCQCVDKSSFHTCSQTDFCSKQRFRTLAAYKADFSNVKQSAKGEFVFNVTEKQTGQILLAVIGAYRPGVYRLTIEEEKTIGSRYRVAHVLTNEVESAPLISFTIIDRTSTEMTVKCALCNDSIFFSSDPFLMEIKDEKSMAVMSFNSAQKLYFANPAIGGDISFHGFDRLYGLPEHADSHSLKSTVKLNDPYRLFNLDVFEYEVGSQAALYGSIPIIYAHRTSHNGDLPRTVGILWLNAAECWIDIDLGKDSIDSRKPIGVNRAIHSLSEWMRQLFSSGKKASTVRNNESKNVSAHWMFSSGLVDVFFMTGSDNPLNVVRQFTYLTGTAPLPPLSTLGYHQSRWSYMSQDEVMNLERLFDEKNIPLDNIWLDLDYTDDPHIKVDDSYFVYKEGKDQNRFVKSSLGTDFEGHCWPGKSCWVDYFDPKAGEWYSGLYNRPDIITTDYTWNDMNEMSVFGGDEVTISRDAIHHDNRTNLEVHNLYGHLMSLYTQKGHYMRPGNKRSFVLTRAFFAGTQRFAAVWTGDNFQSWEQMRVSISMILSLSISGISFAGADIGGFFDGKTRDAELYTRWHQLGMFLPFYRTHSHKESTRKEPWSFDDIDPKCSSIIGRQIERRYLFSPLVYTLFRLHEIQGDPVIRPLWMGFPSDENALDIEDAFMLGSSVLIYPVLYPGKSTIEFYVPQSSQSDTDDAWISMLDLSVFHGGQWYRESSPLDGYANVLLKLGRIFPFKFRPRRSLLATLGDPLTLFVCPDSSGKANGQVYVDDGVTMAYKQGHFVHRMLVFEHDTFKSTRYVDYKEPTKWRTTNHQWIERIVFCNHGPIVTAVKISIISLNQTYTLQYEQTTGKYGNHLLVRKPGVKIEQDFVIEIIH